MGKSSITIFTPVYNRAHTIKNLYESLIRQTYQDFVWYVINDGSSDDINEVMSEIISEKKIKIIYESQKNSGKHVAHNRAVANCTTDLFFCVDSDDYLTDDAIEQIEKVWMDIPSARKQYLSGIVANKGYQNGEIVGSEFPSEITEEGLSQLYAKGKRGDAALIFRTDVIKQYPFPFFEGERFLREHIAYDEIDKSYKLFVLNKIIYICEYLDDGLSRNAIALEMNNPKGAALARWHDAEKITKKTRKIRKLTAFLFFSIVGHDFYAAAKRVGVLKTILLLPLVFLGYLRYKFKELI